MTLLTLQDASLKFGHVALLDKTNFSLEEGERVGLIGRNGTGKSSLLKILAQQTQPDDGALRIKNGVRIAYVAQEAQLSGFTHVFEAVSHGLEDLRNWIDAHAQGLGDLNTMQSQIEAAGGWNWEQRVHETLGRLHLDADARIDTLSGGTAKRVALAQALVTQPDVLLLDEPTNHLDIDSILWLEDLLLGFKGSIVTITHDRSFLDRIATRILELDRGMLLSFPGNFTQYLSLKESQLQQEQTVRAKADKLLAQEEIWVRKGVEARRTRSQSRISRLQALRAQRAARREAVGRVKLDLDSGMPSGKIVAELTDVAHAFGHKVIAKDLSATFLRGDKVGLVAPNGAGKSTLLKIILGELEPDQGKVRRGSNLQVAYFDQLRESLQLDASLEDFISPGSEWIEIGQQRKHVKSYLGDFLFSPERAHSPVRSLSGGERNRLLLARLFARPANVLVLDEPTNDLDIETLELLEELLQSYEGTVFIVSHDRRFLDNVVTSTLVYESVDERPGFWREYEGNIEDWIEQSRRSAQLRAAPVGRDTPQIATAQPANTAAKSRPRKLSYKEQRELEALPGLIAELEAEQTQIRATLSDSEIYVRDPKKATELHQRDAAIEDALMQALERWESLSLPTS